MTPEITRSFGIDMGHRLKNHESKCRNLHGHRYTIEVSCRGEELDTVGRVIDFGLIKLLVGAWLDEFFDHGFVVESGDPIVPFLRGELEGGEPSKHLILEVPPTVENLVDIWFHGAAEMLEPRGLIVTKVKAYETPNCWAEYTRADYLIAKQKEEGE